MTTSSKHASDIIITFAIDTTLKLNKREERYMTVSVVAKQGDVGQVSQFDMTNWKTDIAAEVDRVMRLLMSGSLNLPEFPNMNEAASAPESSDTAPNEAVDQDQAEAEEAAEVPDVEEPDGSLDEYADYEMTLYEPEGNSEGSQATLF